MRKDNLHRNSPSMRWKNLKGEYQVIFYFLERAGDMKGEYQMATAKASSNKGIRALSSEAATPIL